MLEFDKTIKVTFDETIDVNNMLSPSVALNLFRVCQEAFNNCLKHAVCSQITIAFKSASNNTFTFTITDNGKGFDVQGGSKNNHYGLLNMQARAQECCATLTINSVVGQGTTLTLVLN